MEIFFDCLLYFNSFAAVLALFASILSLAIWLVKTLLRWLAADPKAGRESRQVRLRNLDYLKRAGQ